MPATSHGTVIVDTGRLLIVDPMHLPDYLVAELVGRDDPENAVAICVGTPYGDGHFEVIGTPAGLIVAQVDAGDEDDEGPYGQWENYDPHSADCADCGNDTLMLREWYMVIDDLWAQACPEGDGLLCIGCLETRIGRQLTAADFKQGVPINDLPGSSKRMRNRLGSNGE